MEAEDVDFPKCVWLKIHGTVNQFLFQACDHFLGDFQTREFLDSGRKYDLMILDGAYPECALGIAHHFKVPYMYINTVGMYMGYVWQYKYEKYHFNLVAPVILTFCFFFLHFTSA